MCDSPQHILDGPFSHQDIEKIALFVRKRPKIIEEEAGDGHLFKTTYSQ